MKVCACGSSRIQRPRTYHSPLGTVEMVLCADCDLARDAQEFSYDEEYSDAAGIYHAPSEDEYAEMLLRMRSYAGFVARTRPAHGKLLDIGCHAGQLMQAFQEAGWSVQGLDLNPSVVAHATSNGFDAECRLLQDCQFPARTFDLVTMSHSLEHIPDMTPVLQEIRRVLKDDGSLFVAVPNFGCKTERWLRGDRWSGFSPGQHIWYFTRSTLEKTVSREGFQTRKLRSGVDHPTYKRSMPSRLFRTLVGTVENLLNDGNELRAIFQKAP